MLCACLMVVILHSCFTGVEGTPKIGKSDLKHNNIKTHGMGSILSDIESLPFSQWHPGKEFLVVNPRISIIFTPSADNPEFSSGDKIVFQEAREVTSPTGKAVEILFNKKNSIQPLIYKINASLDELNERTFVEIPFTIDPEPIAEVKQRLSGKTFYILTPRWFDTNGQLTTKIKYIPVTIINVEAGDTDFPVRLIFHPQYTGFQPDDIYYMPISIGTSQHNTRNFETLFSEENPRLKHQSTTNEMWTAIIENRLLPGMTREEARLALGSPNDVDRRHDYSSVYEQWTYDGGTYLIFRDGILESFRR